MKNLAFYNTLLACGSFGFVNSAIFSYLVQWGNFGPTFYYFIMLVASLTAIVIGIIGNVKAIKASKNNENKTVDDK